MGWAFQHSGGRSLALEGLAVAQQYRGAHASKYLKQVK